VPARTLGLACGRPVPAEIQVGDQGFLALPHRPGQDLSAGRDDDGVAFLDPLPVLAEVLLRDEPVAVRESSATLSNVACWSIST